MAPIKQVLGVNEAEAREDSVVRQNRYRTTLGHGCGKVLNFGIDLSLWDRYWSILQYRCLIFPFVPPQCPQCPPRQNMSLCLVTQPCRVSA